MISGAAPALQQKWGIFLNTFMFKMFAVLCILIWPDDIMTSEHQCTTHYEDPIRTFSTRSECDAAAYDKLVYTIDLFQQNKTDFQHIEIGCEKIN